MGIRQVLLLRDSTLLGCRRAAGGHDADRDRRAARQRGRLSVDWGAYCGAPLPGRVNPLCRAGSGSAARGIRTPALRIQGSVPFRGLSCAIPLRERVCCGSGAGVSPRLGPSRPAGSERRCSAVAASGAVTAPCRPVMVVVGDPWRIRPDVAESVADGDRAPARDEGGNSAPVAGGGQSPRSLDGAATSPKDSQTAQSPGLFVTERTVEGTSATGFSQSSGSP
jgi:hypothetical protein